MAAIYDASARVSCAITACFLLLFIQYIHSQRVALWLSTPDMPSPVRQRRSGGAWLMADALLPSAMIIITAAISPGAL